MSFFKKQRTESIDDANFKEIRERARQMLAQPGDRPADLTGLFSLIGEDERAIFRVTQSRQIQSNQAVLPDQVSSRR